MRSSSRPFSLLLPLISLFVPALGQDQGSNSSSYVQECVQALQDAGFTQLATVLTQVNDTTPAQALFAELSSGKNYTVFAPDNQAFQNVSSEISSNTTLLAEYLSYHFVNGNFQNTSYTNTSSGGDAGGATSSSSVQSSSETSTSSSESQTTDSTATATETATATTAALFGGLFGRQDQGGGSNSSSGGGGSSPQPYAGIWPNVTIGRTLLNASDLVHLEGNKSQVLAWTRSEENGNVTILNQAHSSQNITVVNATIWKNLFINGINGVLIPPGNLTTALSAVNATAAQTLVSSVQVPTENGTNATALEALQTAQGITLFVPNDEAFTSEVNQTLQGLQSNLSAQANLVQNHLINGTTLYSTQIANNSQAVTAAGEPLTFSRNDTGLFVSGANGSTAQIVRPDVLLENGVAHIIDRVLLVESVDTSAASDAYESATSEAAISTTETGPIGVIGAGSATMTQTSSASSASSSESSSSSAESSSSSSSELSSSSEIQSTASETSTGGGGGGESTVTATATGARSRILAKSPGLQSSAAEYVVNSFAISIISGLVLLVV